MKRFSGSLARRLGFGAVARRDSDRRCLERTVCGLVLLVSSVLASSSEASLLPRWRPSKSLEASSSGERDFRTLVVKLADDGGATVRDGRLEMPNGRREARPDLDAMNALAENLPGGRWAPALSFPAPLLEAMRRKGEARSGEELADLSQFFLLTFDEEMDGAAALPALLAMEEVENAYFRPATDHPMDKAPPTPDFSTPPPGPGQGYRNAAPLGVNAQAALQRNLRGEGTVVADIETNWRLSHEDLSQLVGQVPPVALVSPSLWFDNGLPIPPFFNVNHGTATLGVIAARHTPGNPYGVFGFADKARIHVIPIARTDDSAWSAANAVALATAALPAGSILVLEVQVPISPTDNIPFETFPLEFAVTRQATALGLHVIEAAGNSLGGRNLDTDSAVLDPGTGLSLFDPLVRDSGAVLVGAGESVLSTVTTSPSAPHYRYVNSNYGQRVNTFSWGQNVTTTGFGPNTPQQLVNCANLVNPFPQVGLDQDQWYTYCYDGTSAATAIVAGVAALLEQRFEELYGQPATPQQMRALLSIGTPSEPQMELAAPAVHGVGHQPDLQHQLSILEDFGILAWVGAAESPDLGGTFQSYGSAVAAGADVDGDGVPDYAVGNGSFSPPGGLPRARAYLYSGRTGGLLRVLDGPAVSSGGSLSLALADVDGDGLADLVMGVPLASQAGANAGAVQVFSGMDGSLLYTLLGTPVTAAFYGSIVANAGDVDLDGRDDLLINVGVPSPGRVEIRSGASGSLLNTLPLAGLTNTGATALVAGDFTGAGLIDVAVGTPDSNQGAPGMGAVFVFNWIATVPSYTLTLGIPADTAVAARFGASLAAGDTDGDGIDELIVGAPSWSDSVSAPSKGKVFIYDGFGSLKGSFSGTGVAPQVRVGSALVYLEDFDGDGFADIASGQPIQPTGLSHSGRVEVRQGPFSLSGASGRREFYSGDIVNSLGSALTAAGDVNGDGRTDLLAGDPRGGAYGWPQGTAYLLAAGPGPHPLAGQARLVASSPVIETQDMDGDGLGGGCFSPELARFTLDAGPDWASEAFVILPFPDVGSFLTGSFGNLDSQGTTQAPQLGPFPSNLVCPAGIGFSVTFVGGAVRDTDGDGQFDDFIVANPSSVTLINEGGSCVPVINC